MAHYDVSYTTRGGSKGRLTVIAETPEGALDAAREIHNRTYPVSTARGWAGPGVRSGYWSTGVSHKKLPKAERDGMIYAEPVTHATD